MSEQAVTGTNKSGYFRPLIMLLVIVVSSLLIWHTLNIMLLIFLGVIFAVFLSKTSAWISSSTRLSRKLSTGLILLILLGISVLLIWYMVPRIADQVAQFKSQLPDSFKQLEQIISKNELGKWLIANLPSFKEISGSLGGLMHQATAWMYSVFGAATGVLIIFVLGLYLAFDADVFINGAVKLAPKNKRLRFRRILHALGATLYWWLIGRLFSMLIVGVLTVVGLWLLQMPLALTLGAFAAVMAFVPNIGPLVSVLPAVLLALQDGWVQVGYVTALYAAIQTVESYLITPIVQRKAIAMPPALILSAQIIMGVVQGVLGIMLATPLTAVIIVLTKKLYIENMLDDHDVEVWTE